MLHKISLGMFLLALSISIHAQQSREFRFHYAFTVKNVPAGKSVRLWIPTAQSDDYQEIKIVSANGDLPLKKTRESKYGNQIYYTETSKSTASELHFDIEYDVTRHERIALNPTAKLSTVSLDIKERRQDLQPDVLVPITGIPAQLAVKVTTGKNDPLDKARAIYDYVFTTMKYDKSGTGWGHGDVLYACDAKKGNCTDFHSLFIAMARSQGIPARFEIGFPLPADKHSSEIAGYHCWAEFFNQQNGWIPVDISEAWRHQAKKDYYFGAHDADRVQFSVGRDLKLNPPQAGEPLNYFIYPYVETSGKTYSNISNDFSFSDADGNGNPRQSAQGGE